MTRTTTPSPTAPASTRTAVPDGDQFKALSITLASARSSNPASVRTAGRSPSVSMAMPAPDAPRLSTAS